MKCCSFLLFTLYFVLITLISFAQGERKHIREGNKQYEKNKYDDAAISYRKSLEENARSYEGAFNLGAVSYKQNKYEDAVNQYELLTHQESDKNITAMAYHNLGNSLLQSKRYEESIKAYKNALRNNPSDLDTKYNLAYAQAKLKQEQEQEQQQQQQDQENKQQDQKQQGEDKSQQKEQDNKKEQNKEGEKEQEQEQTQQKEQQQQPHPDQISKKDAERLLDAINNEEKDIQEKLKKKKARVTKIKIEKDW